jgi:hypothetical protein
VGGEREWNGGERDTWRVEACDGSYSGCVERGGFATQKGRDLPRRAVGDRHKSLIVVNTSLPQRPAEGRSDVQILPGA